MDSARIVAVVVPSPATSDVLDATSRTSWAPIFSYGSSSSISFATVTPSLVMVGLPNFLSRMTLRPDGPSVAFTAFASFSIPRNNVCRAFSSNCNCLAAIVFRFLLWLVFGLSRRPRNFGAVGKLLSAKSARHRGVWYRRPTILVFPIHDPPITIHGLFFLVLIHDFELRIDDVAFALACA